MKIPLYSLMFFVFCLSSSCTSPTQVDPVNVQGMTPIYGNDLTISLGEPILIEKQGKIVYREPYLLVNEQFKGIHVYDNSDPNNPTIVKFIHIPGNIDFSLKGDKIYANSFRDLITLELSGFDAVNEVDRITNHYNEISTNNNVFPSDYVGPFECYDESKGFVLGWKLELLDDPKCFI